MQSFLRTVGAAAWATLWSLYPGLLWAQGTSPWVDAVNELQAQFTGPIARGLSLIAIVVGGLMFAFGEGGSKRTLAGIIFGLGMAMGAANFWPDCLGHLCNLLYINDVCDDCALPPIVSTGTFLGPSWP